MGRWSCVEWHFDGINNQMHFWMDGQAIESMTVIDPQCGGPWQAPAFERVDLGWGSAPAGVAVAEMWIDDVGIDSQRIGCPGRTSATH
jgi:hypothetical protein